MPDHLTRTPTDEYIEWCDELYRACERDHGFTPYEWIMENNDGEEHKHLLFTQMKATIKAAYARKTAANTLSAWLGDNIFRNNPHNGDQE